MVQVTLRRKAEATVSCEEAVALVRSLTGGRVLDQSGSTVLVEVADEALADLQQKLPGWIVAPQGEKIPVPDTRLKIRSP